MVSENLAREMWGLAIGGGRVPPARSFRPCRGKEVIGVIQDVRENRVQEKAPEIVYWGSAGTQSL